MCVGFPLVPRVDSGMGQSSQAWSRPAREPGLRTPGEVLVWTPGSGAVAGMRAGCLLMITEGGLLVFIHPVTPNV